MGLLCINCIDRLIVWVAEAQYSFQTEKHPRLLSFAILHFYYPHQLDAAILKIFTEICRAEMQALTLQRTVEWALSDIF